MRTLLAAFLLTASASAASFESFMVARGLPTITAADTDHDGICNLLEFALADLDPLAADSHAKLPSMGLMPNGTPFYWNPRPNISGVRFFTEASNNDLRTWESGSITGSRGFLRLRVEHSATFGAWSDAIDARIAGKGESAKPVFSQQDHANGVYVRNPLCWGADIDLTPISPWNSLDGALRAGILISPRHVLFASHYPLAIGTTMRFVTAANVTVERTLTNTAALPVTGYWYSDLTVGLLDSDVPAGISFARVLPTDYAATLPTWAEFRVPCIATDQEENLTVAEVGNAATWVNLRVPEQAQRLTFREPFVSGDSGSPVCLVVDGQLVLLTCLTFGSGASGEAGGSGNFVTALYAEINVVMATLGGGYQLTPVTLTST